MLSKNKRLKRLNAAIYSDRGKSVKDGYYITDTFEKFVCNHFIPQAHDNLNWCKCGNDTGHHTRPQCFRQDSDDPSQEWNVNSHTDSLPTDAFGEINFICSENDVLPLYLRCKLNTEVEKLSELLLNKWTLPKPNLLISVFGGHSKFDSSKIDSDDIHSGLIKAATSTKAWIFTSGVDVGVSHLVGNAISKKRTFVNSIPVIGVNCWGAVRNNEELVNSAGLFPAHYDKKSSTAGQDCIGLERHHTHFLLMDCGTRFNFHENQIRRFRIKFQQEIVSKSDAQLISIMIEGGVGSLSEARMRIQANLPVLILGNSGRISNVISEAFERSTISTSTDGIKESEIRSMNVDDKHRVLESLSRAVPGKTEEEYEEFYRDIEFIIRNDHLVTIWSVGNDEELDKAILIALIKSLTIESQDVRRPIVRGQTIVTLERERIAREETLLTRQLGLAIQWNRLDLAVDHIFKNMSLEGTKLNDFLYLALQHERGKFVKYLIEIGGTIKHFLTEERFEEMLNNVEKKTLLYKLMSDTRHSGTKGFIYEHFAKVVKHISEGVFCCPAKKKPTKEDLNYVRQCMSHSAIDKMCEPRQRQSNRYIYMSDNHEMGGNNGDNNHHRRGSHAEQEWETVFNDPENLLVIYYVLIHKQDMAKLFWEYSRTPVFLAIVCCNINKWLARQEKNTVEITSVLAAQLEDHAKEFEALAFNVLDEVSKAYPTKWTRVLVEHEFRDWGGLTILEIADYTNAIKVLAHSSVQDLIEENWMGLLDPDLSYIRLFLSLLCPLLSSFRFAKPSDGLDTKTIKSKNLSRFSQARRMSFIDPKLNETTGEPNERKLTTIEKLKNFYHAPVTKFLIYITTYICFLGGYSMALLLKPDPEVHANCEDSGGFLMKTIFKCKLGVAEMIIYIWIFSIMPLELRQMYFTYPSTVKGKLRNYFRDLYNKIDALSMLFVVIAFCFKTHDETTPLGDSTVQNWNHAIYRFFFAFAFVMYCIRLCQAMQINSRLGPKVMMIASMLQDLVFFIGIVAVCIVAYGVSTEALINPNRSDLSLSMLFYLLWRPYVNLFGEFGIEDIAVKMNTQYCILNSNTMYDCENEDTMTSIDYCQLDGVCTFNNYAVHLFLGVYMMLAAVLMLNLLVAVFTSTYEKMTDMSSDTWKMQKFDLMNEFSTRSAIPFPFSSVYYICLFLRFLWRKSCGRLCNHDDGTATLDEHGEVKVSLLESECRRNYLERSNVEEYDVSKDVKTCLKTIDELQTKIIGFEDSMQAVIDKSVQNYDCVTRNASSPMHRTPSPFSSSSSMTEDHAYEVLDNLPTMIEEDAPIISSTPNPNKEKRRGSFKNVVTKGKVDALAKLAKISKRTTTGTYPGTSIRRFHVKKEHGSWHHPVISYNPVIYNASDLVPEKSLSSIGWNALLDDDDRRSYEGVYQVMGLLPLNPCGRTGLSGRGKLPKWGPNYVALPIITRYAHNEAGLKICMSGKPVLETLLHKRSNDMVSLPENKTKRDDPLSNDIKDLFQEENIISEHKSKISKRINKILNSGVLIYRGYLDSEFNTDNSWLESIVVSYHDVHDNAFPAVHFPDTAEYLWSQVKHTTLIQNSYRGFLQKAFYARDGYDYVQFPEGSSMNRMF